MFKKLMKLIRGKKKQPPFLRLRNSWLDDMGPITVSGSTGEPMQVSFNENEEIPHKLNLVLPVNPSEILELLESPIEINVKDVQKLITKMKKRIKFIKKELNMKPENEYRVLAMLEARKKYPKYAHLFNWKTTTQTKIDDMLNKYSELRHRSIADYISHIPDRAITEMEQYKELYAKVADEDTIEFTLIAPHAYFKEKELEKDPILLALSPFGNYFYVLCAWDKEINVVDQLLREHVNEEDKNGENNIA